MSEIPTYLRKTVLSKIYPYNVAIVVLGDEADVYRIHVPTLCRHIAGLGSLHRQVIEGIYFYGRTPLEVATDTLGCSEREVEAVHDGAILELRAKCKNQPVLMCPAPEKSFRAIGSNSYLNGRDPKEVEDPLSLPIEEIGLPAMAARILSEYGIGTMKELTELTRDDLEGMRGFGSVCFYKTLEAMKQYGCRLREEE